MKIATALLAISLIGAAPAPVLTCDHAVETEMLALLRLKKLNDMFDKTEMYSPPREVLGAEILGILQLLSLVDEWKSQNCKEG